MGERRANGLAPTPKEKLRCIKPNPLELVRSCGITFEPAGWFTAELDEPLCDECGDA